MFNENEFMDKDLTIEEVKKILEIKKKKKNKKNIKNTKIFLCASTIAILVGGINLEHNNYDSKKDPNENMCPIAKFYYENGNHEKAFKHQITHLENYYNGTINFEYVPEGYSAPNGYKMNPDGVTCSTYTNTEIVETNGKTYEVAPAGYVLKNGKAVKTIEASYNAEYIIGTQDDGKEIMYHSYNEEEKKLVKTLN